MAEEKLINENSYALKMLQQRCKHPELQIDKNVVLHNHFFLSTDFSRSLLTEQKLTELAEIVNLQPEMILSLLSMSFRFPVSTQCDIFSKIFLMKISESKVYDLHKEFLVMYASEFKEFAFFKNPVEATELFKYNELKVERKHANTYKRVFDCFMMIKVFPQMYTKKNDSNNPSPRTLLKPKDKE